MVMQWDAPSLGILGAGAARASARRTLSSTYAFGSEGVELFLPLAAAGDRRSRIRSNVPANQAQIAVASAVHPCRALPMTTGPPQEKNLRGRRNFICMPLRFAVYIILY